MLPSRCGERTRPCGNGKLLEREEPEWQSSGCPTGRSFETPRKCLQRTGKSCSQNVRSLTLLIFFSMSFLDHGQNAGMPRCLWVYRVWSPGRWGPKRDLRSVGLFGNAGHLVADRHKNESAINQLYQLISVALHPCQDSLHIPSDFLTYWNALVTIRCIRAVFQISNGLCLITPHLLIGWS